MLFAFLVHSKNDCNLEHSHGYQAIVIG